MTRTISQLAKELNVNVETIRFYERKGLITQPPKPGTGYRHYSDELLNRMRFILRAKQLGFSLDEIARLLSLNDRPCRQVRELAQYKLNAVQQKMADLHRLEQALEALLTQCESNEDESQCPIIDALNPET